ncbi:protein phosphatase 1L [Leptinotarsa decemlineata]|uniref:protein phosphatase 1L n=1 Tax=Leptinotarsa decemlineata TaxID=7539 RepID=UPI000C2538DB|nr:protein phosphatase 1L [Leptinotarsa decemlineata]XP_023030061.1 protein phosphatase 1L [Leptinotarsa decemlineata]XP_023030062.1 protein phosphatase 1L [Leptinotarsa decemlineata]XP_023030063.1 protein phosphatase 1L [Leptinotarsa decemlineata]
MEDELDDKIIYQTYVSHMKIMSRIAWSVPLKLSHVTFTTHIWRLFKLYLLKPELIVFGALVIFCLVYLQATDLWSRHLGRLQYTINRRKSNIEKLSFFGNADVERSSWQMKVGAIAAYAVQGRRGKMEDRFVINDNINNTGVALFAVFDGHGGEFAANFAKEKLAQNLFDKVIEIKDLISGKSTPKVMKDSDEEEKKDPEKPVTPTSAGRRKSFRRTSSTTDECIKGAKEITDLELLTKLDNIKPITRSSRPLTLTPSFKKVPLTTYFDKSGTVNYGKLLTDEVLAADERLVQKAKKSLDVAGTTALIAILEGDRLVVANVGDSRGVMCDGKGNAIPLSFDHKPQQMRERKRIEEAGGFVTFTGVWRVAGILATSRALGDYPLKDRKLVIADPDILTFDLKDHKPSFLILASDGLWDTFANDEAVSFIKERLNEPDYGAKSLTLQSYYRGSLDNITVIIINFKDNSFSSYNGTKE